MKKLIVYLDEIDEENIGFTLNYIAAKIKKGALKGKSFPTKWELKEENEGNSIFILFETDLHQSKQSRVFLGAFESSEIALKKAKENNCIRNNCKIEIKETEINNFNEI